MIIGAHIMIQSTDDAADQAFLTNVLKLSSVDAGNGFLIFGVPPAEIAVHGSDKNGAHELFLMCEDIEDFIGMMREQDIAYTAPRNQGWGTLTQITLPGGGTLGIYQPHHKRPKPVSAKAPAKNPVKKKVSGKKKKVAAKKPAGKAVKRKAGKR